MKRVTSRAYTAPRSGTVRARLIGWVFILLLGFEADSGAASHDPDFNRVIRPILSENCYKCHGPDDAARKSNLRFDNRTDALKPAKSGRVAIVPSAPEKSEMLSRVSAVDSEKRMPPVSTGKKLTASQISDIR